MRRVAMGLVAALAAGCGVNTSATFSVATVAESKHSIPQDPGPIDYAGWPMLTEKPVEVDPGIFLDCRAPSTRPEARRLGLHAAPLLRYYAKPEFETAVKSSTGPLPVGTTIVKEKWWSEDAVESMAYAAMVKREPGYDPDHGDWEYVYVSKEGGGKRKIERGKLMTCINCHRLAKDRDYLFRTYLKK